ncbi:sensor histidine kinase [Curtanaerobium respiraculi]|uniref:sensor histidine kinase n=1 Tax=Curtanaerobium respiraculi TaxID=2949669 RepID=UPI0024B3406C|nr:HAMP domain-containing sensor histidine kinase [Curtanaerobium respiraculi]
MDPVVLIAAFAAGTVLAGGIVSWRWRRELARMTRFLLERDAQSNVRLHTELPGRAERELALSINRQLDDAQLERIAAARHAAAFQRDLESLSHDIRTPLAGAKGYLQLAGDEEDAVRARRYLEAAEERLDSANELVEALFSYTKSLDDDVELKLRPVLVLPLLSRVLVGQYPAFEARGWQPTVSFADEGCTLDADEEALARIFDNLVANMLRHGVSAPRIVQSGHDVDFKLAFENEVADPVSIDTNRLFERFYRGDSTRSASGSGLGLATARQLAQRMDLELSAELDGRVLRISLA